MIVGLAVGGGVSYAFFKFAKHWATGIIAALVGAFGFKLLTKVVGLNAAWA